MPSDELYYSTFLLKPQPKNEVYKKVLRLWLYHCLLFGMILLVVIQNKEEKILARCLDSVADLADEIIIADTGSTDGTKEVAKRYTKHVYDFKWTEDFSAARNFVFSRATKEYIYSADADEVLSPENRERFRILKETLLPEIEIVQMKYANQLSDGGTLSGRLLSMKLCG